MAPSLADLSLQKRGRPFQADTELRRMSGVPSSLNVNLFAAARTPLVKCLGHSHLPWQ